jgi:hypothetical protein
MIEVGHRVNDSMIISRADRTPDGRYYFEVSHEYAFGNAKFMEVELPADGVLTYDVEVED